jgi:NAD(P)H-quinone oxidoreductase subunit 5
VQDFIPPLLVAVPALSFLAGLLCHGRSGTVAGRIATTLASTSLALALVLLGVLIFQGPATVRLLPEIALRLDAISMTMAVLVSFLGLVVLRFSRHYLHGDPQQARFFSRMCLTLGAVLTLVLSGGFLVLAIAWIATSFFLHGLLLHFPNRPGAIFSARKKFVISRLGDACMIAALAVIHANYGTWDFTALFESAAAGNTAGLPLACTLLAICAALKSAQFPFHGWLPDTMETPTPVSAFMHAGIINAGGFLIIRTSPLFVHASGAMVFLTIIGTLTAAFGAIVMLVQPGVKRSLAYSTIAQMGFMILQCGLGAFGLALIHIVAHSLYKAHAFLHAGSSIGAVRRAAIPLRTSALLLGTALVTGGAVAVHYLEIPHGGQSLVFAWILGLALAYGLARAWSGGKISPAAVLAAVALATGVAAATLALHQAARVGFTELPRFTPAPWLVAGVAVVFAALFAFQCVLWRAAHHPIGRRLYVHALQGFYIGTLGNRLLGRLWPRQPAA